MPETGSRCENVDKRGWCQGAGRSEFCGYCAHCWAGLNSETRRTLSKTFIPNGSVIQPVIERVRVIYPAKSRLLTLGVWLWRVAVTVAIYWLVKGRLA